MSQATLWTTATSTLAAVAIARGSLEPCQNWREQLRLQLEAANSDTAIASTNASMMSQPQVLTQIQPQPELTTPTGYNSMNCNCLAIYQVVYCQL